MAVNASSLITNSPTKKETSTIEAFCGLTFKLLLVVINAGLPGQHRAKVAEVTKFGRAVSNLILGSESFLDHCMLSVFWSCMKLQHTRITFMFVMSFCVYVILHIMV